MRNFIIVLTLSWRRPLSYRNQFIDLLCKSMDWMDWFLYDNGHRHERVNAKFRKFRWRIVILIWLITNLNYKSVACEIRLCNSRIVFLGKLRLEITNFLENCERIGLLALPSSWTSTQIKKCPHRPPSAFR